MIPGLGVPNVLALACTVAYDDAMNEDRLVQVGTRAATETGCRALNLAGEQDRRKDHHPSAARDVDGQAVCQTLYNVPVGWDGEVHIAGVHVACVTAHLGDLDASRNVEPDHHGSKEDGQQERCNQGELNHLAAPLLLATPL